MKYKGVAFHVIRTAYGDGYYALKQGRKIIAGLPVDAGLLSLIPYELAATWPDFEKLITKKNHGIVVLGKDSILEINGGNFKFDKFSVKTG